MEAPEVEIECNKTKSGDHAITDQSNHKIQCKDLSKDNEDKVT